MKTAYLPSAVIFDMDGVLIDSQPLHCESDSLLLESLGIDPSSVDFYPFFGMSNPEIWALLSAKYALSVPLGEILRQNVALKLKLLSERDFGPIAGIPDLLALFKREHILLAVASSSSPLFIDKVLDKIGIAAFFDSVVSGESVAKSKPEPDVFLKAAELLGVLPQCCVVVEDSGNGVIAAKRAGMKCVAYKNPSSRNQDISQADMAIDSFAALSVSRLRELWWE